MVANQHLPIVNATKMVTRHHRVNGETKDTFPTTFTSMQKVWSLPFNIFRISILTNQMQMIVVPLHVLYSYDASSSDDEIKDYKASPPHAPKSFFHPTNRLLNKMPRVHKIDSKQLCTKSGRKVAQPMRTSQQTPAKPTVFQQLDTLKRYLRTTGIKVNVNDILKGNTSMNYLIKWIQSL